MSDNSLDKDVYRQMFWDSLQDYPALRFQLIELVEANTMTELAREWGFSSVRHLLQYVRGPLRRRLRRVCGGDAVKYLRHLMKKGG